jgi:23S rRNA (adenine2030-N6)-methyltransferase
MLSYQHIYHAGNRADVHKHRLLCALLATLTSKERPISYLETHAGSGLYDLGAPEAVKTGEAADGVEAALREGRVPADDPWLSALRRIRAAHGEHTYPGSPALARQRLRPGDVMHLFELHPQAVSELRRHLKGPGVHIHHRDGYEGALAIAPPTPRRGLVLVDPSYEVKTEYQAAADFVLALAGKWPQACIALWYPLLPAGLHEPMLARLAGESPAFADYRTQWAEPGPERGMYGSGLAVLNPPWGLRGIGQD